MSAADELHSHNAYGDNTGIPVPSSHRMRRGYQPVTTSATGQHIHNYPYDPSDTEPEEGTAAQQGLADTVTDNDFWVDTTPEETEEE